MVIFLPKLWVTATQLGWVTRLPRKRVVDSAPSGWVKPKLGNVLPNRSNSVDIDS